LPISLRAPKKEALKLEPSTGNLFADLGLADAAEHLIKAGLVVRIDRTIRQRKLTQAAAAQLMGIDQPKISAILAGRFRGYSVERLRGNLPLNGIRSSKWPPDAQRRVTARIPMKTIGKPSSGFFSPCILESGISFHRDQIVRDPKPDRLNPRVQNDPSPINGQ
jgi:predicted XRE-type DNA-binding protein